MTELKRELGLFQITMAGIGIILGAGIYALIGEAAGLAGNGVWISFILASVIAGITGLGYAELSSMFPKAGAEYVYAKYSMGNTIAFMISWLIIVTGIMSASTVALGFGGYFSSMTGIELKVSAIGLLAIMALILFKGVKETIGFAIVTTLIEVFGLAIVIFVGL
ncbi:MAG TPA: amino acid permease, partial [Candidatus Bilamarchaeaceae archaeon]|nr:amino acid permease [Candidatus Bilamarchaeaceae archaeon]